jgi:uncharacterized protein (UPF0218 family)
MVLYGQPGEGVVVCEVNEAAKEKAITLLSYFVEHDDDTLPASTSPGG